MPCAFLLFLIYDGRNWVIRYKGAMILTVLLGASIGAIILSSRHKRLRRIRSRQNAWRSGEAAAASVFDANHPESSVF